MAELVITSCSYGGIREPDQGYQNLDRVKYINITATHNVAFLCEKFLLLIFIFGLRRQLAKSNINLINSVREHHYMHKGIF